MWIETISLKRASKAAVDNFIGDNVNCCFEIPKRLLSDNSTSLVNMHVLRLLAD